MASDGTPGTGAFGGFELKRPPMEGSELTPFCPGFGNMESG
jgi:hypothetical protein